MLTDEFFIYESVVTPMRLSSKDISIIIETFQKYFESGDLYLFGSRTDDSKKGGDLDLYIKYDKPISFDVIYIRIKHFRKEVFKKLNFYKVDVVYTYPGKKERRIDEEGQNGILLFFM